MTEVIVTVLLKNFFKVSFALLIMGLFFYIMMPFMIAIILGGILAMALLPFVDFFISKGLKRENSLLLFTFLLGATGLIPVIAFFIRGSRVISEILHESNFAQIGDKLTKSSYQLIDNASALYGLDNMMIRGKVSQILVMGGQFLSTTFSTFVSEMPTIIMMGLITTLSLYCFLREADKIRALFDRYFYFNKKNGNKFILMFKLCCREIFFSNIITGVLQASVVSIGALIFGVGDFFLIFFITFVCSFIPIIGAAPVAAVLGIICFMESRIGPGIGMMVVAAFSGVSDNIVRPLLGSMGVVNVHPFIGLLAVIGGVIMFGLPGLFIGPLIVSLSFGALPIIIEEYFPPNMELEDDSES